MPKEKITAYDYRGMLLLRMVSGLVLVFGPPQSNRISQRPLLYEAKNLADAQTWVDLRFKVRVI